MSRLDLTLYYYLLNASLVRPLAICMYVLSSHLFSTTQLLQSFQLGHFPEPFRAETCNSVNQRRLLMVLDADPYPSKAASCAVHAFCAFLPATSIFLSLSHHGLASALLDTQEI